MRDNATFKINVKNGLYIGDICYALDEKTYHEVWGGADYEDGAYTDPKTGLEFAVVSTAYGDGCYDGFLVDAGNIGIVDLGLCTKSPASELDHWCGQVLSDFVGTARISYDDGTITVEAGDFYIEIETASEDDEYDEDDWWQDDWDSSEEEDED